MSDWIGIRETPVFNSDLCPIDRSGAERAGLAAEFDAVMAEHESGDRVGALQSQFNVLVMALWAFRGTRFEDLIRAR